MISILTQTTPQILNRIKKYRVDFGDNDDDDVDDDEEEEKN